MPPHASVLMPSAAPASDTPAWRSWVLDCRGIPLDCSRGRYLVMGILNVTPDSFSDGGRYQSLQAAVDRAGEMADEGAIIIDIGGESTRPRGAAYGAGAEPVGLEEEIDRVAPVIEAVVAALPGVVVSVDTYKGAVARAGLDAGAHMVNDVTGLRLGIDAATAAALAGAALVVMHSVGVPSEMPHVSHSDDIVAEVLRGLAISVGRAEEAGVSSIAVDVGFGFGKTPDDNLRLIAATERVRELGRPILVGVSRKATVGLALGSTAAPRPLDERLFGSLGLAAMAALRGAAIVRTHDVGPTVDILQVMMAADAAEARLADEGHA